MACKFTVVSSDARCILGESGIHASLFTPDKVVEKEAVFQRLSEDRFYNCYPCIIVTAKGNSYRC